MANKIVVSGQVGTFTFRVTGTNVNRVLKVMGKLMNGLTPKIAVTSKKE